MKNPIAVKTKKISKPMNKESEEAIQEWKETYKNMPGPMGYTSEADREDAWKKGSII